MCHMTHGFFHKEYDNSTGETNRKSFARAVGYSKHPISWFRDLRRGAHLSCDVCYSVYECWMYQWILVQTERDYTSSILTYRSLDTQLEIKIEKATLDSQSEQLLFHYSVKLLSWSECRINKRDLLNSLSQRDAIRWHRSWSALAHANACSLRAPSHNLDQCCLEFLTNLCSAIFNEN